MRRPALILAVLLGSCASPAPPPPVQRATLPPPARPVPIPQTTDWRDWPLTPGTWRYRRDPRGSIALFGRDGSDAVMTLRCDLGERRLYLSLAHAPGSVTVRTSSTLRALTVQPTGGTPAYVATALSPSDPLLDAIGFSRGRFVVEQAGAAPLVVPAWAEILRVTEDCRG